MSQLRAYLENYVQDLQTLMQQHSDNQELSDAAEDKWGAEDARFMILQERPKQQRWLKGVSGQPEPELQKSEEEPNELITWLPSHIETLEDLLKKAPDDKALVEEAAKKWEQGSYGTQVVKQGLN